MTRNVVIVDGVRSAVGTFGGALKDVPPTRLAAGVAAEALRRSGIEPGQVGQVVFGHVINTEPRDMYLSRVAAVEAGIPAEVPALTLNRLCGSGLQALVTAAQAIQLGDCDAALAGGAEVMSRSPYSLPAQRWGQKMGDAAGLDMMVGALTDPFGNGHMGVTAENLAEEHGIAREEQDRFAAESHRRTVAAIREGRFRDQILPVEVRRGRETVMFDTDEHARADVTAEALGGLKPVFKKGGTVTAGNASGINDGAAALVLMAAEAADKAGLKPRARLLGYALAGVEPRTMGIGPVPAVRKLLERTGLRVEDFDVVESNEAFAAQACAVSKCLGLDPARTNPNGGAIALGHPIGASGAIIAVKALHELARTGGRRALMTMCIGGGQGIAVAVEAMR